MKKYILLLTVLFILFSCSDDFLERNPLDKPSNEAFWNTEADAIAALNGCYNDWYSMDNVIYFDCASDNAYNPYPWEGWQVAATGMATPTDYGANFFDFTTIIRCNNFLANIDRPEMSELLRKRLIGEARFIRAWRYFLMVTLYGDVPLVTTVLPINDANLPRDPKDKVMDFIIQELKEVIPELSDNYTGSDVGRITKGAALSLKARMELFAGKYSDCIATCNEIMSLGYELLPNYTSIFTPDNENSKEVILNVEYEESSYTNWVLGVMPPNSSGGWSSINPTQALVDAYECIDGNSIEKSDLYNPKEPYKNRDPRLAASIVYPGALYNGAFLNSIDVADPNGDYYAPYGRSKTGYYPRKYVNDPKMYPDIWKSGMNAIVIRYAEILLMYAEAKIETNSIDISVYETINKVRQRAGMPDVDITVYNNQSKLRDFIRRERRVELAMEGIRWFDVCRWKIGESVMAGNVTGALLGKVNPDNGFLALTEERIFVEKRVFNSSKNYLWPIPQSVIDATPAIKQNPGY